uniref:Uncharacterized protein n=1 Tax=Romanomermis culicivorax TaxID=13658 RepID=A0A915IYL2_ROMCU
MYYTCYSHNSISIAALECLSALLQNPSRSLMKLLENESGLGRSQIFSTSVISPESSPFQSRTSSTPVDPDKSATSQHVAQIQSDSLSLVSENSEPIVTDVAVVPDAVQIFDPLSVAQIISATTEKNEKCTQDFSGMKIGEVVDDNDEKDVPLIDLSDSRPSTDILKNDTIENDISKSLLIEISTPTSPEDKPQFSSYPGDIGKGSTSISNDHLLNHLECALIDEHFAVVKSALNALKLCQNSIFSRDELFGLSAIKNLFLNGVLSSMSHTYWPVKLALLELWGSMDFTKLVFLEWLTNVNYFPRSGCLSTLCQLTEYYPPSVYFNAYSTILTPRTEHGAGIFTWLIKLLTHGNHGTDHIYIHCHVFTLISHFLGGYFYNSQFTSKKRQKERWSPMFGDENQMDELLSDDLMVYCLKILNIYVHVISETPLPNVAALLSKTAPAVAQQTLTPVAQKLKSVTKIETGKVPDKNDLSFAQHTVSLMKVRLGDFSNNNHFLRIYDSICLDEEVKDKFISLLVCCFQCFGAILEIATLKAIERFIEELLFYLKNLMMILPCHTINTVTQVLKALFGTNLNLLFSNLDTKEQSHAAGGSLVDTCRFNSSFAGAVVLPVVSSPTNYFSLFGSPASIYQTCIMTPRARVAQRMATSTARHDLLPDALT